jgi:hypothetical protein
VRFTVTDKAHFDLQAVKEALKKQRFNDAKVVAGPS